LVKNPSIKTESAVIHYHEVDDYLSREEKLALVKNLRSVSNPQMKWRALKPNEHGDWLNQRNELFDTFIPLAPEKKFETRTKSFFVPFSLGIGTNRDAWVYNSSQSELKSNISRSIDFYNDQRLLFHEKKKDNPKLQAKDVLSFDSTNLNWTDSVIRDLEKNVDYSFNEESEYIGLYRPFFKQRLYFSKELTHRRYQQDKFFPTNKHENTIISICGTGINKDFTVLITDVVPDLQLQANGQCFPLYFYEEQQNQSLSLFDEKGNGKYQRKDGLSDFVLERARKQYGKNVTKEDIFYYVYGILHSSDYREKFSNDLKKVLPRLPLLDDVRDFWAFSKAGRKLAELHLNYESIPPYNGVEVVGNNSGFYAVEKMRFPKKDQRDTIIYNSHITITNIPAKAYEYVVNGKSAVEWIMERYQMTVNKDSGIKNDPNDWAKETGNPRYILDLLLSIINVSVQTVDIVNGLPKLNFRQNSDILK